MPSFSERQAQAENLIRSQIESLENTAQTIPYWEVYRAITGTESNNGGGLNDIITGTINEDIRIIETPGIYNFNNYFYLYLKIINGLNDSVKLKSGEGDFRLISKEVVESIIKMTEYNRFSKGIFEWVGFNKTTITYDHLDRNQGRSKYSNFKLIDYAIDGIVSFNNKPLRLCFYFGGITMFICLLYILITFINTCLS